MREDDTLDSLLQALTSQGILGDVGPRPRPATGRTGEVIELVEGPDGVWAVPPAPETFEERVARMQAAYRAGLHANAFSVINLGF